MESPRLTVSISRLRSLPPSLNVSAQRASYRNTDLYATLRHLISWGETSQAADHFGLTELAGAEELQSHVTSVQSAGLPDETLTGWPSQCSDVPTFWREL